MDSDPAHWIQRTSRWITQLISHYNAEVKAVTASGYAPKQPTFISTELDNGKLLWQGQPRLKYLEMSVETLKEEPQGRKRLDVQGAPDML